MEDTAQYEQYTKEELIQVILDLKKEIEGLKHPVRKDSTNSSLPSSKDLIQRTRSQREKSGKKAGGQQGHLGHHRECNPHPDSIVMVQASHCAHCGASLEGIEGTIGQTAQQVDIPAITPLTTQYQQVIKVCSCGECIVHRCPSRDTSILGHGWEP